MIKTIVGVILLIVPFLFVLKYKNKTSGFISILSYILAGHLVVALITQWFHIFNYPVILTIYLVIDGFLIAKWRLDKLWKNIDGSLLKRIDWALIVTAIIVVIHLYQVHFNYTGTCNFIAAPHQREVAGMAYEYPYYSDEWYAVSLMQYSIDTQSLPLTNPLKGDGSSFVNMEIAFHATLAELALLLNLDPLTDYSILTILFNSLICLVAYLFIRFYGLSRVAAVMTGLSMLYITSGANLPGLWTMIPVTMGLLTMLMSFFYYETDQKKMLFLMVSMSVIFYPPLFPFHAVGLVIFITLQPHYSRPQKIKEMRRYLFLLLGSGIILTLVYFAAQGSFDNYFNYIFGKLYHPTFTQNAIPRFMIWDIVPIPILLLMLVAIPILFKRVKWLVGVLILAGGYWLAYTVVMHRFIIEYQRVVLLASILVTISAGFGLDSIIAYLQKRRVIKSDNVMNYAVTGLFVLFLFLSLNYTEHSTWKKLKLVNKDNGMEFTPAPPANNYLHQDDLQLFKNIKKQKFLSIPWKGTAIGVATGNYPASVKHGTIGFKFKLYDNFMNANCEKKFKLAQKHSIDYVYAPEFRCQHFLPIGRSRENLILYKIAE